MDSIRAYKVILDGKQVSYVYDGQSVTVEVAPGRHQLYMKLDLWRSNIVEFEAGTSDILFECGSPLRGWRLILTLFYGIFLPRNYIWLRRAGGLQPGPSAPAAR